MDNTAVVQLITDAFGLSYSQEAMIIDYSSDALEYAVTEYVKQKDTKPIPIPINWIAAVARNFEAKEKLPKTGRMKGFNNQWAPKIVEGKFNANHSPAPDVDIDNPHDPLNLTTDQRIEFASMQDQFFNNLSNQDQISLRTEGFVSLGDIIKGWAPNIKERWKHLKKNPHEFPPRMNVFKKDDIQASEYGEDDPEYEAHLENISKDKSDPEGYKLLIRKYDYRRIARK